MRTCVTARPFRFRLRFGFGLGFRPGFELRLEFRLRGISRDVRLVLRIDRTTSFEHFIRLLDMIKGVHHENFVIVAEKRG